MAACKLQAFLLEQSRIVMVAKGERNYHIFYAMIFGASAQEKSDYCLLNSNDDYAYTKGQPTSRALTTPSGGRTRSAACMALGLATTCYAMRSSSRSLRPCDR